MSQLERIQAPFKQIIKDQTSDNTYIHSSIAFNKTSEVNYNHEKRSFVL